MLAGYLDAESNQFHVPMLKHLRREWIIEQSGIGRLGCFTKPSMFVDLS